MGISIGRQFETLRAISAWKQTESGSRRSRRVGLSTRLLLVTVAFFALAEIMIYVPAVATYRTSLVADRWTAAEVAALVMKSAPGHYVSEAVTKDILTGANVLHLRIVCNNGASISTLGTVPKDVTRTVDLRNYSWIEAVTGAWDTLTSPTTAVIRIIGSGNTGADYIEGIFEETPLRQALTAFSLHLLLTSLLIAAAAPTLVFVVLQRLFVQPIRRLAHNISNFAENPEDADRVIAPSGRSDEIGKAEIALAQMELVLAGNLRHKRRLASVGLSVSKISHELRNLLTTAQLLGDRLETVADPVVQRVAPRLVETLDRANRFCEATLAYGRAAERHPERQMVPIGPILDELQDLAALARDSQVRIVVRSPEDLTANVDPEQLSRALTNLVRNAVQALDTAGISSPTVTIEASRREHEGRDTVTITVTDNGPGFPERARTHLFSPFKGSMRSGGTGLGLAIASELTELNGGTLQLCSNEGGARFLLTIPDREAVPELV